VPRTPSRLSHSRCAMTKLMRQPVRNIYSL
jgi:hypothetical protein